jgi:hypothetical protein
MENLVATMAKKKSNKPHFKVHIPFISEKEKEDDPKEKPVDVKLTTAVPNPITVMEWYNVALKTLN